jgi:hypothetical protein
MFRVPSLLSLTAALLAACAPSTVDYHPSRYAIDAEEIRAFDFPGPVYVRSVQDASEPVAVAPNWKAPLQRISEALAQRMREELASRSVRVSPDAPVELRISLERYMANQTGFTRRASSRVLVSGGDRFEKRFDVESHVGSGMDEALDKNLAASTITILNDPDLRNYLRTASTERP